MREGERGREEELRGLSSVGGGRGRRGTTKITSPQLFSLIILFILLPQDDPWQVGETGGGRKRRRERGGRREKGIGRKGGGGKK